MFRPSACALLPSLKDWQLGAHRPDPCRLSKIRDKTRHQSRIRHASSLPGDGRYDDDPRTIRQAKKKVLLTWAWHPKPLPMAVPNSFALAAAQFGHDLRIAHPSGYELDEELIGRDKSASGSQWRERRVYHAIAKRPFDGVDVVYAKSWGSYQYYGNATRTSAIASIYRDKWIVDEAKMAKNERRRLYALPAGAAKCDRYRWRDRFAEFAW